MEHQHLNELIALEDAYWWHVAKRELVTHILQSEFPPPGRLIEGGTGSARNLLEFQRLGYRVGGMDSLAAAVEHARSRGLEDVHQHDLSEPWPWPDHSSQVVVLLDVLEHMADPVGVLQHAKQSLEPGGGVVFTVPAYPWLFSDWDRALGHYRRYTPELLRRQAGQAGLQTTWLTHWNAFSLPAAVAVRSYERCVGRRQGANFPRVAPAVNRIYSPWRRWSDVGCVTEELRSDCLWSGCCDREPFAPAAAAA